MPTPPSIDHVWLSDWIQPHHTAPEAVERYQLSFSGSAVRLLLLPDFLLGGVADRIADFLATEANFTEQFAIREPAAPSIGPGDDEQRERLVTEAEWLEASPERRFFRFSVGPGQPTRMSPGWMRYFGLRSALYDVRLAGYLEAATRLTLGPLSSLTAHAMRAGDMLAPHSDVNRRRQLAFLLYLTREWRTSYGGGLLVTHRDGDITRIEPTFNTLVLFEVTAHKSHRVEPIAQAAGTVRRLSLGGWFDRAPDEIRRGQGPHVL